MTPETISMLVAVGVGIPGMVATEEYMRRRVWRGYQRMVNLMHATAERIEAMSELLDAQMRVNGGGSLVDKVNVLRTTQQEMTDNVAGITGAQVALAEQLDEVITIARENRTRIDAHDVLLKRVEDLP